MLHWKVPSDEVKGGVAKFDLETFLASQNRRVRRYKLVRSALRSIGG